MVTDEMTIGWLSKNSLDRHRPAFMAAEWSLLMVGFLFWIDASGSSMGFAKEVFGQLAYSLPAKFWALVMMVCSAITIMGLRRPITHWMVLVGAFCHCIHFLLLSYSAAFTGGAFVIGLFASVFFLPLHMWILFEAVMRGRSSDR